VRPEATPFSHRWRNRTLGALLLLGGGSGLVPDAVRAQSADPERQALVAEAARAMGEGKPYRASRLLVPVLTQPGGRDPAVLLLGARAAAGWEGWGTVVQLLASQSWIDSLDGGEGRALLARARVERSEPAVDDARRALGTASPDNRGDRLVVLARAFDRADQLDSAGMYYGRAAAERAPAAEWLRLRAAGVTADSSTRARLLGTITLPAAVPRIQWTEALARSRARDYAGAARVYAAIGALLPALRMRLQAATDSSRPGIRRDLFGLIGGLSGDDLRAAIALLDTELGPFSAREELLIARRAGTVDPARAVSGFARAAAARLLTDPDRLSYGMALGRTGRHREAIAALRSIRAGDLLAQARYQSARSLLSLGQRADAVTALRDIFVTMPGGRDTATFAVAGYLAADLLSDNGDDRAARQLYAQVARRFPRSGHGPRAAFQAAMIGWTTADRNDAIRELVALADQPLEHAERAAALYWSGRGLWEQGDTAAAGERYRAVLRRFPGSYYAMRAAVRLGLPAVPPPIATVQAPPDSALEPAFERAAVLERLGLKVEARFEYDRLSRLGETGTASRITLAREFLARGMPGRAYRLALPVADATDQRLVYPLLEIPFLIEAARRAEVDPLLAAALIRQESAYDETARSRADARGMMQVMPSLGASMARGTGIREWDTGLLYQPEINLRFGLAHLAEVLRRYPDLPIALAAYNAGSRAAELWAGFPGARADLEVFIERIQYVETRDYVRRILRNLAVYQALYPQLRPS
jgi:soluble lytic murein transglycosylase